MKYQVDFTPGAESDLSRLDAPIAQRVLKRLRWLAENFEVIRPEPLTGPGQGVFRWRVGDYRVLYTYDRPKRKPLCSKTAEQYTVIEQNSIRVRACLAVVQDGKILLVPHFNTDQGPVQWNIPGGRMKFGESVRRTAIRELQEETGIRARIVRLLDVSEVLLPEKPWQSLTVTFLGEMSSGELQAESQHPYGSKMPHRFTLEKLRGLSYHPQDTIKKALEEHNHDEG